jgi:hypothetical protein
MSRMEDPVIRPVGWCPHYQVEVAVIETAQTSAEEIHWRCQLCLGWHRMILAPLSRLLWVVRVDEDLRKQDKCH